MRQYNFRWICSKCDVYHNWWIDSCDLKSTLFKCKSCSYSNQIQYQISNNNEKVECYVKPYYIPKMSIQEFVNILPIKPTKDLIESQLKELPISISLNKAIDTWCTHDALHYISGIGFNDDGEQKIRFLEERFNVGWWNIDSQFNTYPAKKCNSSRVTLSRIQQVSQQIKMHLSHLS